MLSAITSSRHSYPETAIVCVPPCRIVSATDLRKYDDPPGLQDNAEIALNFLAGV
jgi:hypothetical protein